MLHPNTPSFQRSTDSSQDMQKREAGPATLERIHGTFARLRGFLSECLDVITVEHDDEAWMVEPPLDEDAKTPLIGKILHPRRSLDEALHGLTRGVGAISGMTEEERLRIEEPNYQEGSLFRSIGGSAVNGEQES